MTTRAAARRADRRSRSTSATPRAGASAGRQKAWNGEPGRRLDPPALGCNPGRGRSARAEPLGATLPRLRRRSRKRPRSRSARMLRPRCHLTRRPRFWRPTRSRARSGHPMWGRSTSCSRSRAMARPRRASCSSGSGSRIRSCAARSSAVSRAARPAAGRRAPRRRSTNTAATSPTRRGRASSTRSSAAPTRSSRRSRSSRGARRTIPCSSAIPVSARPRSSRGSRSES